MKPVASWFSVPRATDAAKNARIASSRVEVIWYVFVAAEAFSIILTRRTYVLFPSAEILIVCFWGREDHASLLSVKLKPVQLLPPLPPLRGGVIQQLILLLPMMMLLQVAQCMQQRVVNAVHGCLHQPGVQHDQPWTAAAPPTYPHRSNGQGWNAQSLNARRTHCETFVE